MGERKNRKEKMQFAFLVFVLFLFIPSRLWSAEGALEKVRLAYPARSLSALQIKVAQEKGFFAKYGLQVEAIQMRPTISAAALISGEVQYLASVGSALRAAAMGAHIKVLTVSNIAPFFSLVARSRYKDIQELRGKEIGVTGNPGGSNDRTVRVLLRQARIEPDKDVKLIHAGDPPVLYAAFSAGRFDAISISLPFPVIAEQKGDRILVNAAEKIRTPLSGLAVTDQRLKEQRDQAKRMLKAHIEAQRFIKREKEVAIDIMMRWLGLERAVARRSYDLYIPGLAQEATVEREGSHRLLEQETESGVTLKITDVERLVDGTLAEEVNRELDRAK